MLIKSHLKCSLLPTREFKLKTVSHCLDRCFWTGKHELTPRSSPACTRGSSHESMQSAQALLSQWPPSVCEPDPRREAAAPERHTDHRQEEFANYYPQKPPATLRRQRWPLEEPHGVRVEKLLHALEERISAAGQEGRQVCVDLRAHLAALLPTLQLDAEQRKELLICNTFNFNHTRQDGIFQTHNESSCQLNIRKVKHSRWLYQDKQSVGHNMARVYNVSCQSASDISKPLVQKLEVI